MSIWRLREMRNQAVAPIRAPTQMLPMLSHITLPVKCTAVVHAPAAGVELKQSGHRQHVAASRSRVRSAAGQAGIKPDSISACRCRQVDTLSPTA